VFRQAAPRQGNAVPTNLNLASYHQFDLLQYDPICNETGNAVLNHSLLVVARNSTRP
jgi:hypothetical protein